MMWYPRNIFVMRNGRKQSIFLNISFISQHAIESQITSLTIVFSTVYSDADQRKHQSSVSLAFVRGIHRGPVNSPHKWPVTRKMFLCDDVVMYKSVTGSSLPCSGFATILNLMLRVLMTFEARFANLVGVFSARVTHRKNINLSYCPIIPNDMKV